MNTFKGLFGGECNRTACTVFGAVWYNHSTRAYYCQQCAHLINEVNSKDAQRLYGHNLCTMGQYRDGTEFSQEYNDVLNDDTL